VNHDEAKTILLPYRPGPADAEDPQIAGALALAKRDPELAGWLEAHCARQFVIGEKFRQLIAPAGLKEQIISEQAASEKMISRRQKIQFAMAVIVGLLVALAVFWFPHRAPDDTLAIYQNQMAGVALRGYAMDLTTNDPAAVRAYLAQNHAPADFILSAKLKQAALTGCAVESWQGVKVSMICFHTGQTSAANEASDLWLFVVDRAAMKDAPAGASPQLSKVNRLITATWTQGDKLYLLGTAGDEQTIRQYL